MKNKSLFTLTIAAFGLLGLTACNDMGGTVTKQEDVSIEPVETHESQPEEAAVEETEAVTSDRPTLGDTWTYSDGLGVTISQPKVFTPSQDSFGGENSNHHVKLQVTIQNGTGQDFDPSMVYITASSGGSEADEILDFDEGLEGAPMTTLLDGQNTTYEIGFGVNDPADITVEFTDMNDFNRDTTIFVSE